MSKTPAKTEEKGQSGLPALNNEEMLQVAKETAAALPAELQAAIIRGQEDIQPGMPFAALRQKGCPGKLAGGLKFNDDRPDAALPKQVVVLAAKLGRVCWDKDNLTALPRCKSTDGKTRLEEVPDPGVRPDNAGTTKCAECIRRLWPRERQQLADRLGQGWIMDGCDDSRPECQDFLNLLCCEPDGSDFFILSLHGTSFRPAHNYLGRFKRKGMPFFVFVSELVAEYVDSPKGSYYVARWDVVGNTSSELVGALAKEYPQLLASLERGMETFDEVLDRDWGEEGAGDNSGYDNEGRKIS